jgi:hypothetical protein
MRRVADPDAWPAAPRGVLRMACWTLPAFLLLITIASMVR